MGANRIQESELLHLQAPIVQVAAIQRSWIIPNRPNDGIYEQDFLSNIETFRCLTSARYSDSVSTLVSGFARGL